MKTIISVDFMILKNPCKMVKSVEYARLLQRVFRWLRDMFSTFVCVWGSGHGSGTRCCGNAGPASQTLGQQ